MADSPDDLEALERAFWMGDADFYRRTLTPGCLMVFPSMGIVGRNTLIAAIEQGPRWSALHVEDWHRDDPAPHVAIVAYRAAAMREGMARPYVADCGSLYVESEGEWRLAFHQQTPVTQGA